MVAAFRRADLLARTRARNQDPFGSRALVIPPERGSGARMTPQDRARIAAQWGIPETEIPQPTICPPRKMTPQPPSESWKDIRKRNVKLYARKKRMTELAQREGRQLEERK